MLSRFFASGKNPTTGLSIKLLPYEGGVDKKTFSLSCDIALHQAIEDQLKGYFRIINEKIISNRNLTIKRGISFEEQFPDYYYKITATKDGRTVLINITGTDIALQSAIESLISARLCKSRDFSAFPSVFSEYAIAVEAGQIQSPSMF